MLQNLTAARTGSVRLDSVLPSYAPCSLAGPPPLLPCIPSPAAKNRPAPSLSFRPPPPYIQSFHHSSHLDQPLPQHLLRTLPRRTAPTSFDSIAFFTNLPPTLPLISPLACSPPTNNIGKQHPKAPTTTNLNTLVTLTAFLPLSALHCNFPTSHRRADPPSLALDIASSPALIIHPSIQEINT